MNKYEQINVIHISSFTLSNKLIINYIFIK